MSSPSKQPNTKPEAAFSIVECLVAISLLSVAALAVAMNTVRSYTLAKRSLRQSISQQLALSKIEEFAAIDPATVDASDNESEVDLVVDNISFSRTTTVTVNADESVTVQVTVANQEQSLGGQTTLTDTFPLWGNT